MSTASKTLPPVKALERAGCAILERRRPRKKKAAALMGLEQPDVSALVVSRTGKFSIDRLVRCLDKLNDRVDVVVSHKRRAGRSSTAAVA